MKIKGIGLLFSTTQTLNEAWVLDFGAWASVYRTWLTCQAEYRKEGLLLAEELFERYFGSSGE